MDKYLSSLYKSTTGGQVGFLKQKHPSKGLSRNKRIKQYAKQYVKFHNFPEA